MLKYSKTTNLTIQKEISSFLAPNNNDIIYGNNHNQLLKNINMEYISNGSNNIGLGVRKGSSLQKDVNSSFVSLSGAAVTTDCYYNQVSFPLYQVTDDTELKAGFTTTPSTAYYESALKWDVSSIPAGAVITSAHLKLTVKDITTASIWGFSVNKNDSDFTVADGGNPTLGERFYYPNDGTSITASDQEIIVEIPTTIIDGWIAGDSFGITFQGFSVPTPPATPMEIVTFHSSTSAEATKRPVLEVYYYMRPINGGIFNYNYTTPKYVWLEGDYDNDNDGILKILTDGLTQTTTTHVIQAADDNKVFTWNSGVSATVDTPTFSNTIRGGFYGGNPLLNAPEYDEDSSFYALKFSDVTLATGATVKSAKLRLYVNATYQQAFAIYTCASDFTSDKGSPYNDQPLGDQILGFIYPNNGAGYYEIPINIDVVTDWADNPTTNYGIIIGYKPVSYLSAVDMEIQTFSDVSPPQLVIITEAFNSNAVSNLKTGMTDNETTSFVPYGIGTASALYGANIDDGIFKVSGSTPAHSSVTTAIKPAWIDFSDISGRLMAVKDHYLFYSRVNVNPLNTTNLETFTGEFAEIFEIDTVYSTGISSTFVLGETITGSSSSNTAVIVYIGEDSKQLYVNSLSGAFTANELITGSTSGTTAYYRRSTYVDVSNKNLQYATISPDQGKGFTCCIDNAQTMFLFKDTGIWALPNANDDPLAWIFPKCDADIGTLSPKSVKLAKYGQQEGIIYLGSDNTLRFFTAQVERNSGTKPTLKGGSSLNISVCFQNILDTINEDYLYKVTAIYYNKYYILNIPSDSAELNKTIIIDTEKLMQIAGNEIPQPYWFEANNLNYPVMLVNSIDNNLYGIENNLYLNRLLVPNYFKDDFPQRLDYSSDPYYPILYKAYTIFSKLSDYETELYKVDLSFYSEHDSNLGVNGVNQNDVLPDYSSSFPYTLAYNTTDNSTFTSLNIHKRGHYFNIGVNNNEATNNFKLYNINMFFKMHRRHQLTRNY